MKLQHPWPLTSCHVSKDGRIWAGSVQGELLEADWESERLVLNETVSFELGVSGIVSIDYLLVASSWDGSLVVLDYIRNQIVKEWRFEGKIFQLCGSEETVLCSLSSGRVKYIQFPSWDLTETDSGLKYQSRSCALIPNNRGFVQGSVDGRVSVELFDEKTPKFAFRCHRMNLDDVQLVFPVTSLAFQSNSLNLFTGGADGKIVSWNLVTRKKQEELPKVDDTVVKLCCTEDFLIVATSDDSFKTCATPQEIELHPSQIYIKHL
ncbi:unnamed protein product [Kluyveromyces dobzhanskii CBS 2104]|uniref:WGS project CCBQ000000000 data, contig 00107 n=1 Tax=Kluyveromyces dobzhanskii CBS 2104 TaxID=1427455 RepID=A0A0A8KYY3_9SACH|nr:unnamed protein product [Kluyveromyces dobzhanskii CBS 2104]